MRRYEVISTPTSIYMVIEYAGGELFNYIVDNTRVRHWIPEELLRSILKTKLSAASNTQC